MYEVHHQAYFQLILLWPYSPINVPGSAEVFLYGTIKIYLTFVEMSSKMSDIN